MGIVSCLLYVSNWVQVLGTQIDPLGHTWTLAIEEQFYLLWPTVLILLGARRAAFAAAIAVGLGAVVQTEATGTLEYFSTVARGDAILVGCLVAMRPVRLPHWLGSLALGALVILAFVDWSHDITIPLVVSASVIVITSEVGFLGVLAPIGRRAYALYLWDWPLTILFGSVGGLAAIAVATLSYRLVERPLVRVWARRATRISRAEVPNAGRMPPGVPPLAGAA